MLCYGLLLFVLLQSLVASENPIDFLDSTPYGYYFVDLDLTDQELEFFESIKIEKEFFYHSFSKIESVEGTMTDFFQKIGDNSMTLSANVSKVRRKMADEVLSLSGKEYAWVHISAQVPTEEFDIPRWHLDGHFYHITQPELMYKFVFTPLGPPTLFYRLERDERKSIWQRTVDRVYMQSYCQQENIVTCQKKQGAFFIGGNLAKAALHSEPAIKENRIFFCVIPCTQKQLGELKQKIVISYPKKKSITYED